MSQGLRSTTDHQVVPTAISSTISARSAAPRPRNASREEPEVRVEEAWHALRFARITRHSDKAAGHTRSRRLVRRDGRTLRRYRHRWKIERLFAWIQNYRWLVTRYEYYLENFTGMLHLAC